jgi:hypothetical protein
LAPHAAAGQAWGSRFTPVLYRQSEPRAFPRRPKRKSPNDALHAKLIERHGAKLPDLREVKAGDCPRVGATSTYERRGGLYPQLVAANNPS